MTDHDTAAFRLAFWLLNKANHKVAGCEVSTGIGRHDVLGVQIGRRGHRITCIEVKDSISDLRADLRAGKMLRYAAVASHCYLAFTHNVPTDGYMVARSLGLPREWGFLRVHYDGGVEVVHKPTALFRVPDVGAQKIVETIAVSLSWRAARRGVGDG